MATILVVDDSTYARRRLRQVLEQREHTVVEAGSGMAALESYLVHSPAVVLLDLKMPKVDGMEVLRRLKADDQRKIIPVVVLTSSKEHTDILESYKLGVNAYIVKPVDYDKFTKAISEIGLFWLSMNQPPK